MPERSDPQFHDTVRAITDLLDPRHCARRSGGSLMLSVREVATRMAEAGWRPPAREVRTVADLETVPEGTLVLRAGSVFGFARIGIDYDTGETSWTACDPFRHHWALTTTEVVAELNGHPAYVVDISTSHPRRNTRSHSHSSRSDS